jgi:hypothetical protein
MIDAVLFFGYYYFIALRRSVSTTSVDIIIMQFMKCMNLPPM